MNSIRALIAGLLFAALGANAAGDLDRSFGDKGTYTTPDVCCTHASVADTFVQADGKVLLAGSAQHGFLREAAIARLNLNGTLDQFGVGGVSRIALGDQHGDVTSVVQQPDGKLAGAAWRTDSSSGRVQHSVLFRLDATGKLDSSFGNGGIAPVGPLVAGSTQTWIRRVLLQPDGKLVTVGGLTYADATTEMFVARFSASGALDTTFGNGGVTVSGLAGRSEGWDAALAMDGSLYVAGDVSVSGMVQSALMKLHSTGARDSSFGVNGVKAPVIANGLVRSTAMRVDGRVLVGGRTANQAAVALFSTSGVAETSYGTSGIQVLEAESANPRYVSRLITLPGDQALALLGSGSDSEVRRLHSNGAQDTSWTVTPLRASSSLGYANGYAAVGYTIAEGFPVTTDSRMGMRALSPDGVAGPESQVDAGIKVGRGEFVTLGMDGAGRIFTAHSTEQLRYPSTFITRLTSEGRIDPTFGAGGRVLMSSIGVFDTVLVVKPNGKIVFGSSYPGSLAQLNPDGSVDTGFVPPSSNESPTPGPRIFLLPLPDNRVVFGNPSYVARLLDNGSIDPSFNGGQPIDNSFRDDFTSGALLPGNRLALAKVDASIEMRDAGGAIEPGFGNGGRVQLQADANTYIARMVAQPDGKLIVAGVAYHALSGGGATYTPFAARLLPSGVLDGTFGNAGYALRNPGLPTVPAVRGVAVQDDGRILVSGNEDQSSLAYSPSGSRGFVWRVNADGTTDTTFATNGTQVLDPSPGIDTASAVQVQAGGRILVPGGSTGVKTIVALLPGDAIADSTVEALVTRYYSTVLGRTPDTAGLAYWKGEFARMAGAGAGASESFYVMAMAFFASPEYLQRNTSTEQFVTDLYRTFFDREPDKAGRDYWVAQIAAGEPRTGVLASFLFSPEFANFMAARFGAANAGRAEVRMATDFYRGLLLRLPDPDGLSHWVLRLRAAACSGVNVASEADQVSAQFVFSAEYATRQASLPTPSERNSAFVVDLYNALMRRGPDLDGYRFYTSRLDAGTTTREEVRRAFLASPEFQGRAQAVQQACRP